MMKMLTILLAVALDLLIGDPPNHFHPVVLMGRWLSRGRQYAPQSAQFLFGLSWLGAGIALFTTPFFLLRRCKVALFASPLLLKWVFAYRGLRRAGQSIASALSRDDIVEARRLLSWHLVSRDTSELTEAEVIGATIESIAENLTDSFAAPLYAYALGGLPAAWGYRLVNTADAMWGYRTPELEQLGKFPARLDDALNWLPARLTGWLLVLAAGWAGGDMRQAARTMLAQHGKTASPNAGWTMAAMAGACRITLTKRDAYALAGGDTPLTLATLNQTMRIADRTAVLIVASACLLSLLGRFRTGDTDGTDNAS